MDKKTDSMIIKFPYDTELWKIIYILPKHILRKTSGGWQASQIEEDRIQLE